MIRSILCLSALSLFAQGPAQPAPPVSEARRAGATPLKEVVRAELGPAETGTPEALAAALYAFISGPKDQKRDPEKIRALFHPQARLMVSARHPDHGAFLRPLELEAFLAFAIPQWEKGFFERSTAAPAVQKQDGVAQVWSPYEIRLVADGPALYTGVNALQCAWDGKRWWITHLAFQNQATAALQASPEPRR